MNEANRETLSALMDGQLSRDQVRFALRRLQADAEAGAVWSRYHVARDAMRQQGVSPASAGFADRVMAGIERLDVDALPGRVAGARRGWVRWSAGGAIAAGVAAVALMIAQPQGASPSTGNAPTASVSVPSAATQPNARTVASATPPQPSQAAQVPRWLLAGNSALQSAQPASATVDGSSGNIIMPAAYSQQMAPYMNIHRPASHMQAHNDGQYIIMMPVNGRHAGAAQVRPQ
ncbi:sigma-E factor negative regulatory protein [Oleiagrimonas sp. C23AA]|uniref:sigma-E factor negative regulatory protein n=1 Tax=Oleiagrimonas sp. C23AA TaxID=2719047 RepID=UPI001424954B|nr:sigma-E factor negative regulatory protein [Oleiagrimonas sp. C23AA]NII10389.1 anti-anti-sigma factor [Oleiagrimonas sp. C23AA]